MAERIKLTVLETKEPQTVGQKGTKKLAFKALNPESKELWYFTFRPTLFEYIKKDTEIDIDLEVTEREVDGNIYTDRKITDLYIKGEAVGGEKKGGFSQGDSPEKRASIEAQSAAKICSDLLVAGKIDAKHPLAIGLILWILQAFKKAGIEIHVENAPQTSQPKAPASTAPRSRD